MQNIEFFPTDLSLASELPTDKAVVWQAKKAGFSLESPLRVRSSSPVDFGSLPHDIFFRGRNIRGDKVHYNQNGQPQEQNISQILMDIYEFINEKYSKGLMIRSESIIEGDVVPMLPEDRDRSDFCRIRMESAAGINKRGHLVVMASDSGIKSYEIGYRSGHNNPLVLDLNRTLKVGEDPNEQNVYLLIIEADNRDIEYSNSDAGRYGALFAPTPVNYPVRKALFLRLLPPIKKGSIDGIRYFFNLRNSDQ